MEQGLEDNNTDSRSNKKRARNNDPEEVGPDSSELKRGRVDSSDSADLVQNGAESAPSAEDNEGRVGSDDSGVNSPEAKRIREDLINILDDADEPSIQGLDSVMRIFEEEILVASPVQNVEEVTSYSGTSQPDLGYLLEASDDELGLPPAVSSVEKEKVGVVDLPADTGTGAVGGYGEMLGFEEQIPSFDSYEFGLGGDSDGNGYNVSYNDSGEFVAVGGLFDFSDDNYACSDDSGLQWRSESLSAL